MLVFYSIIRNYKELAGINDDLFSDVVGYPGDGTISPKFTGNALTWNEVMAIQILHMQQLQRVILFTKVDSTYILYIYLQGHFVMIEVFSKFISLVIESEQALKK